MIELSYNDERISSVVSLRHGVTGERAKNDCFSTSSGERENTLSEIAWNSLDISEIVSKYILTLC